MLCQIEIFKFSGEETAPHELCWYRGRVVNVLCTIAEHMALPRSGRKVCERSEKDKQVVCCFVGFSGFGFF